MVGLTGCWQSGGELGQVTGTVTLDGKPLPEAMVSFYPEAGGRSAHGVTDGAGQYLLRYTGSKDGAPLGPHLVKVEVGIPMGEGDSPAVRKVPQLPAKYNTTSELTAEVKSGSNDIDFELKSK
ncbi:hypothetical protein DSM3645_23246 [Blastopirellula marina DSM 3645]|uniref:Carboxypeptidase regulatory-like domain-containing protein n=1 Tax=Blastopirellula marina DSM 3645 TaxID=314230 RepID=A3ZQ86_9BACT|nr:hypothetical protein DSM3645_23246 [Blastopirellula marina DSM 3645]